jgi:hypothetical protein
MCRAARGPAQERFGHSVHAPLQALPAARLAPLLLDLPLGSSRRRPSQTAVAAVSHFGASSRFEASCCLQRLHPPNVPASAAVQRTRVASKRSRAPPPRGRVA